jgi:hypothetical protein
LIFPPGLKKLQGAYKWQVSIRYLCLVLKQKYQEAGL